MNRGQTSNVFYTFGFLLLYIHTLLNIGALITTKDYYQSGLQPLTITPMGMENFIIQITVEEILLVGGFIIFSIVGLMIERLRLIGIKKEAEVGWKYRNRLKMWYAIIAIILAIWTTVQGYVVKGNKFDEVWLFSTVVVLIYCLFLMCYPKFQKKGI